MTAMPSSPRSANVVIYLEARHYAHHMVSHYARNVARIS
jgi:hypothetical protein